MNGDDPPDRGDRSIKYGDAFFTTPFWIAIVAAKIKELEDLLRREAQK